MFNSLKKAGSEFAFHMAIELQRPKIIEGLRTWLGNFNLEQFRAMILNNEMPPISSDMFAAVNPHAKYLDSFSVMDLFELLGETSPDLFNMIQGLGEQGALYMVGLRKYLLDCCKHPDKAPAIVDVGQEKAPEMIKLVCDQCKKSWVVKKEKVSSITACPFCRAPAI
jgi:hypothetical protein